MKLLTILLFFSIISFGQSDRHWFPHFEDSIFHNKLYKMVKIGNPNDTIPMKYWLMSDIDEEDIPHLLDMQTQKGQTGVGNYMSPIYEDGLYNWSGAMIACPNGWRIPRIGEWDTLFNQLKPNEKRQMFGELNGFVGYNHYVDEYKITKKINRQEGGFWWSSSDIGENAMGVELQKKGESFSYYQGSAEKYSRAAVRCVKDDL
jgi:uncharacterized protein (TIGR02145 family)